MRLWQVDGLQSRMILLSSCSPGFSEKPHRKCRSRQLRATIPFKQGILLVLYLYCTIVATLASLRVVHTPVSKVVTEKGRHQDRRACSSRKTLPTKSRCTACRNCLLLPPLNPRNSSIDTMVNVNVQHTPRLIYSPYYAFEQCTTIKSTCLHISDLLRWSRFPSKWKQPDLSFQNIPLITIIPYVV